MSQQQYEPLTKPEDPPGLNSRVARFWEKIPILGWIGSQTHWNRRWRPVFRHLSEQLEKRDPIPSEVWGDDPKRRDLAAFIAPKAAEAFGWPNDQFIPEDSFWVIMFPPYDDLCGLEVMMDIEDYLNISLSEENYLKLGDMAFGEAVDFLMYLSQPVKVPLDLEKHFCPSAAIFWNLSAFARVSLGIDREKIRPDMCLTKVFSSENRMQIDTYLAKHFKVPSVVRRKVLGWLPLSWVGWATYILSAVAVHYFLPSIFWWYMILAPIPLTIILCLLFVPNWPRQIVTVADLVNWVLERRRTAA